jgi:hypothetical protein
MFVHGTSNSRPETAPHDAIMAPVRASETGSFDSTLSADNAPAMSEHFKSVGACDGHQRDACGVRCPDSQCRRRRHYNDDGNAHRGRLLHHFNRYTTGQHENAISSRFGLCARELVEGIVAPNVFAKRDETTGGLPERGGVDRPRLRVD